MNSGNRDLPDTRPASPLTRAIVGLVRQFSTPVASIEGAGWMLDDAGLPEEKRREFVGIVRKEAHRLNRTLSEVMAFTRPRPPQIQQLDLPELVDDVIQVATPKDRGHDIVFEKLLPADLPRLSGDAEQIRQALLNLVTNAVQASPIGGRIDISVQVKSGSFVITVKDYGQGIPEAALDRIFDPFFTTRENSLGLGLAVARQVVTEHGGRITVDSTLDKGTSVSAILPIRRAVRE